MSGFFVLVVACINSSFPLLWLNTVPSYGYITCRLFIHQRTFGLAGVVLISTCVCVYFFECPFSLLWGISLGVVGGPLGKSVLTFCRTIHLLQWLDRFAVPSALHKDSSFSRASPKFVISCFCFCNLKILVLLVGVTPVVPYCGFNLHFPHD